MPEMMLWYYDTMILTSWCCGRDEMLEDGWRWLEVWSSELSWTGGHWQLEQGPELTLLLSLTDDHSLDHCQSVMELLDQDNQWSSSWLIVTLPTVMVLSRLFLIVLAAPEVAPVVTVAGFSPFSCPPAPPSSTPPPFFLFSLSLDSGGISSSWPSPASSSWGGWVGSWALKEFHQNTLT